MNPRVTRIFDSTVSSPRPPSPPDTSSPGTPIFGAWPNPDHQTESVPGPPPIPSVDYYTTSTYVHTPLDRDLIFVTGQNDLNYVNTVIDILNDAREQG